MASFFSPPPALSAIKIVKPEAAQFVQEDESRTSSASAIPTRRDSTQRQCRNVMIYGSCKYQGKGCIFQHPTPTAEEEAAAVAASDAAAAAFENVRPETPVPVTPSLSAQAVNAPVFVPKSAVTSPEKSNHASSPAPASLTPSPPLAENGYHEDDSYEYHYEDGGLEPMGDQYYDDQHYDMSYFSTPHFVREPLNYHLYTQTVPPSFVNNSNDSHYMPSSHELRQTLQMRSEVTRGGPAPGAPLGLPDELQGYHTLVPLETSPADRRKFGQWQSTVYRAVKEADGIPYALRRVENFRLISQAAFAPIEQWGKIRHPGIVAIAEAFTTRSFGDSSLVLAYTYYPGARTLYDLHFNKTQGTTAPNNSPYMLISARNSSPVPVPESTLWSYIIQLASAIRRVHEAGMSVRVVDPTKILLTGKNRVRIGSCGLMDVTMFDQYARMASAGQDPQQVLQQQQLDDLSMFGRLIIGLCVGQTNAATGGQFQKSLEAMARSYSQDVKTAALFLISKNNPHRNITHFFDIISSRLVKEMDDALHAADCLENELMGELENARLVRLLAKFGFINERPEFARDARWSETGDRYLIKLFRDYVFHQSDEYGNPVTNLGHVLTCLNKLDAGSEEKVMLIARDEQSCLVVSYREIKSCVENAFGELARATTRPGKW
ncbi:hypothetical protein CYLTODRAFT_420143 [Cylindrobasidium torrendii FP15055 ss-10]|uniref:PAN2-PAN3 deadenylation complex subunit PAN3 n=1 Tax=Cylindrobasidium torrendii FP15055 ss-10 TaxID=1314674 RepID=A0A0D7BIJ6_9AGAR|nr:hypothetical protein CYLTODRAFT_420143 [Cylindrobasidium torrendii FP15055 ss-10]